MRTLLTLTCLMVACCLAPTVLAEGTDSVSIETLPAGPGGEIVAVPALLPDGPSACNVSATDGLYNAPERAFCSADCGSKSANVSCSGPGTCFASDRNCAVGEPGHVICGSTTTSCPDCECVDGQVRHISSSLCCCDYTIDWAPVSRRRVVEERCVDGYWVYAGFSCDGPSCPGVCPL